jgi:glucose-6-phosphate dehydrogenase assembly protein OpcA
MENALATVPLGRARTATLVAVGPSDRLADVAQTLAAEDDAGALHIVRIATDGTGAAGVDERPDVITIGGLRPQYVNNAIAGVRLSSLPTIVWWRGGPPEGLEGVASLADRVVLDAVDPWPLWSRTPPLYDQTAFTDVRWAGLTRWRAALAHFFDLPRVRESASGFNSLSIAGADRAQAALFAGWLDSSLGWRGRVRAAFVPSNVPLESITLRGNTCELTIQLLPNSTCLSAEGRVGGDLIASRVVSLGDQRLSSLLAEELRVRSRDIAFERALERALDPRS